MTIILRHHFMVRRLTQTPVKYIFSESLIIVDYKGIFINIENSSRGNACFHRTRSKMNRARSLRKHSPTKSHTHDKTGKKLISRDFLASDCRQQLFDHDSCESGSAGSSLPMSSIFDLLVLYIE